MGKRKAPRKVAKYARPAMLGGLNFINGNPYN
jgi:hypothetical protein